MLGNCALATGDQSGTAVQADAKNPAASEYEQALSAAEWARWNNDGERAVRLLAPLADQGLAEAQFRLGTAYEWGTGVTQDMEEAVAWYEKAAEQDHATAITNLAIIYSNGKQVSKDCTRALYWMTQAVAADPGQAGQYFMLGDGCDTVITKTQVTSWLRTGCTSGDWVCCYQLWQRYMAGIGVARNEAEANKALEKAATLGAADAQSELGRRYQYGLGTRKDDVEAARWYRKAAAQGSDYAQTQLGYLYLNGVGVPKDYAEAAMWLRRAAIQGNPTAQFNLGLLYANGQGLERDYVQAYFWWNLAAAKETANAAAVRDSIAGWMSEEQIARAQGLARDFRPRNEVTAALARENDATYRKLRAEVSDDFQYAPGPALISQVQEDLRSLGFDPGAADGVEGSRTKRAVKAFQRWVGTEPDGAISAGLSGSLALLLMEQRSSSRQPFAEDSVRHPQASELPRLPELAVSGSGFFVSPEELVTNHHVVDGCAKIVVRTYRGESEASVVVADAVVDVAVVRISKNETETPAAFRAFDRVRLAEPVLVCGFPLAGLLADDLNVVSGEISALAGPGNNPRLVQISAPVQQGNSGGPLLDSNGFVVGVVQSKLDALKIADSLGDIPQNVNFAIKGSVVEKFLDANDIAYRVGSEPIGGDAEEVAGRARLFTVALECYR